MKKTNILLTTILLLLTMYGCMKTMHISNSSNKHQTEKNLLNPNIKIVMLGDSETRRINHYWGPDTNWNTLMGFDTILNYGYDAWGTWEMLYADGTNSPMYLAMNQNPDLICIMIGINDAHQNIPLSQTLARYRIIMDSIQNRNIPLVVQSVLPTTNYYDTLYGGFPSNGILATRARTMNDSLYNICNQKNIPFLDIRPGLINPTTHRAAIQYLYNNKSIDGIHLNYDGYEVWKNNLTTWLINNDYIN